MTVGQLWYSWAQSGAEGTNRFQIVAGSGRLTDRNEPVAQIALRSCYEASTSTLTWEQAGPVRVVTLRTPMPSPPGVGTKRNYLAHALVAGVDALPTAELPRLVEASAWARELPAGFEHELMPFSSIEELGLAPALAIPDDVFVQLFANFLGNALRGWRSSLDLAPARVATVVARISASLPGQFGLLSFCSNPEDRHVERYAVVAGSPVADGFAPLYRAEPADAALVGVVELLQSAQAGDRTAASVVDGIESLSGSLTELITGLAHWSVVTRPIDRAHPELLDEPLRFVLRSSLLVDALIDGEGGWTIAAGVAYGSATAYQAVVVAEERGRTDDLVARVVDCLAEVPPVSAAESLAHLRSGAPRSASVFARALIRRWEAEEWISYIEPSVRVSVLVTVASGSHQPGSAVTTLLDRDSAAAIAAADQLPVTWRAVALAGEPEAVPGDVLAGVLATSVPMRREVAALLATDLRLLPVVDRAVEQLTPEPGFEVVAALRSDAPEPTVDSWMYDLSAQLSPSELLAQIGTLLPSKSRLRPHWGNLIAQSVEGALLAGIDRRARRLDYQKIDFALRRVVDPSPYVAQWADVVHALAELDVWPQAHQPSGRLPRMAAALEPRSGDAVIVALVRRVTDHAALTSDYTAFDRCLQAVLEAGDPRQNLVDRVAVAGTWHPGIRPSFDDPPWGRIWAAIWLCQEAARGSFPKQRLTSHAVGELARSLEVEEREYLVSWERNAIDKKAGKYMRSYVLGLPGVR